jgi:hypothetical protein
MLNDKLCNFTHNTNLDVLIGRFQYLPDSHQLLKLINPIWLGFGMKVQSWIILTSIVSVSFLEHHAML